VVEGFFASLVKGRGTVATVVGFFASLVKGRGTVATVVGFRPMMLERYDELQT